MDPARLYVLNQEPVHRERAVVLYWMTSARRLGFNFALERAVAYARELDRPLIIFEALRCGYEHASDRLHAFVMDGMAEHARTLARGPVCYYPYVEPAAGAGSGLLPALARDACVVVADWSPAFFLPRMVASAARQVDCRMEAVDSNGLLPVAAAGRPIPMAHGFRAHLQKNLRAHLRQWPAADPLTPLRGRRRAPIPAGIGARWPPALPSDLSRTALAALPINHGVGVTAQQGGASPARDRLEEFVAFGLPRYAAQRNQPEQDATSRLSAWLHFGHLSVHEVFAEVMSREKWTSRKLGAASRGAREGWWNTSASAESFLDELVTWRELAFNTAAFLPGYDTCGALPAWARRTLETHRADPRPHLYTLQDFAAAATHDPLWNAIQRQLVRDGWFHGYMRMLWGKKILEWSDSPEAALSIMASLMNRYSLDGRGPNAWAGFAWVLGRYDRPWPEREIFGQVRYMSSANTARKLKVKAYLRQFGPP